MNLDRIFRLQKRACKIIMDYNVVDIFETMQKLKILTVFERLYLRKAKFMYKVTKSETPQYVNEMFEPRMTNDNVPVLRSASAYTFFIPPRPNKEIYKQSITYSGPIVWNSLPDKLKTLNTVDAFHTNFIKWMKN
jgi:hypothetical protein